MALILGFCDRQTHPVRGSVSAAIATIIWSFHWQPNHPARALNPMLTAKFARRLTTSGTPSGRAAAPTRWRWLNKSPTSCFSADWTTSTRWRGTKRRGWKGRWNGRIFPEGDDGKGRPYEDLRWSRFKNFAPEEMFKVVNDHEFPFLRTLGGDQSTYAHHMKDPPQSWCSRRRTRVAQITCGSTTWMPMAGAWMTNALPCLLRRSSGRCRALRSPNRTTQRTTFLMFSFAGHSVRQRNANADIGDGLRYVTSLRLFPAPLLTGRSGPTW